MNVIKNKYDFKLRDFYGISLMECCHVGDADGDSSSKADNTATTTFATDGDRVLESYEKPVDKVIPETGYDTLASFLARPVLIQNINWVPTNLPTDPVPLFSIPVKNVILNNPHYSNKIMGFNLVRATIHFRVVINANPFQQGLLLLHFLPQEVTTTTHDPSYVPNHNLNLTTKTQQPSVLLDCRQSEAIFSMPYIAPSDYYNLERSIYDWGTFYITVCSPLASGETSPTVNIAVYANFTDVEFSAPMVPQSKGGAKKFNTKTISEKEEESLLRGATVSSALRLGQPALGPIPKLSSLIVKPSWALSAASSVASSLGYSKPTINDSISSYGRVYDRYGAVSDGVDMTYSTGLSSTNSIMRMDSFSVRDDDEMSWDFLKKRSAFWVSKDWSKGQAINSELFKYNICPRNLFTTTEHVRGPTTVLLGSGPPMFYLSNLFSLWRGSIRMRLKFVKTQFHTGRLQITWSPTRNTSPTTPGIFDSDWSLRQIVDLKTADEVEFELPYMHECNYLDMNQHSGVFSVVILNELKAPDTCSNVVKILCFVSGGNDLEFQVPGGVDKARLAMSAQVNDVSILGDVSTGPVGGVGEPSVGTHCSELSVGEHFLSIRQLLLRYNQFYYKVKPLYTGGYTNQVKLWPYFIGMKYLSPAGVQSSPNLGGDLYSYLAPMYHFYRGGMRIKLVGTVGDASFKSSAMNISNAMAYFTTGTAIFDNGPNGGLNNPIVGAYDPVTDWHTAGNLPWANGVAVSDNGVGPVSMSVPYYSAYKCSIIIDQTSVDSIPTEPSQAKAALVVSSFQGIKNMAWYRAIAEDFQFSYFVGCPPVYLGLPP